MSFEKTDLRQLEMAMTTIIKTVATLMLLLLVLPLNIALTAIALLRSAVVQPPKTIASDPKTILISGGKMTKALPLVRSGGSSGHSDRITQILAHRASIFLDG
jgi:hypothetical protein